MANAVTAPAQYKQPSRKGKKAWRKNVDTTQIESGLDEVRDQIIHGGIIAEKGSDELFAVDTTGSADIQKEYWKRHKPLKADEILAQRSAVPAVSSKKRLSDFTEEKKRKKARISHKDYDRLRSIAYGGDQVQKDVIEMGKAAEYDPWAAQEVRDDPKFSFLEKKQAKREPITLKQAPVSLAKDGKTIPAVRRPEAGKSYNPNFNDWQDLITREGDKAVEAEKKLLQEAKEEAERMERAMVESDAESNANESAWESEWEGFSDKEEDTKTKRPERKTPAQRNKIKRRKEAEGQRKHEARMKAKDQQAQRIKELAKSVEEKEKARATARAIVENLKEASSSDDDTEEVLRKKRFGKHPIPEAPLEVVLPDELQDSLRRLKPEGNLLKDRFRSMMVRGKVEARRQIPYAKKRNVTMTEKWSYKDWKL